MGVERTRIKQRLEELSRIQKIRHLTEAELWEAADLLRAAGKESAAREAEAAALRQRARELSKSPDATFTLEDEVAEVDVTYCPECGRRLAVADRQGRKCPDCDRYLAE